MYRYERNEPVLVHYGTKDMKWGRRLYQYKDGSLTPLGREHYGYKGKEDTRSPVDRRIAKVQAFVDTIHGKIRKDYLYGKPKYKKPDIPSNSSKPLDKAAKARAVKAEKKKEEEAQRLEEEEKRTAEENIKKVEAERSKERTDRAKQNRWADFTDEELERYAKRVDLEAKATEALLKKVDAPRQIIEEITKYGKAGIEVYTSYKSLMDTINKSKAERVPDLSEKLAKDVLSQLKTDMDGGKTINDLKANTFQTAIDIIGKVNKIEQMSKPGYDSKDNQNKNNNKPKKGS